MAEELSLESLREEIDKIDEVIVRLLDRRARCAYAIGRVKKAAGLPIYEPQREAAVIARIKELNTRLGGQLLHGAGRQRASRVAAAAHVAAHELSARAEREGREWPAHPLRL
jgi:monofunctional chorismate mutase